MLLTVHKLVIIIDRCAFRFLHLLVPPPGSRLEAAILKCMGKEEKPEWEKVDLEKGLRKAGLKSLYPAEAREFDFGCQL